MNGHELCSKLHALFGEYFIYGEDAPGSNNGAELFIGWRINGKVMKWYGDTREDCFLTMHRSPELEGEGVSFLEVLEKENLI